MEEECEELQVPTGTLKSIGFSISNNKDRANMSAITVEAANQVTDSRLGLPNPESVCRSCGSKDRKVCEGHFGVINFKYSIINPYFVKEIATLLNKICPGCKYIRKKQFQITGDQPARCRYCISNTGYPLMKFRVSTKDVFRRSGIVCEVSDDSLLKLKKRFQGSLPPDYWAFLPHDSNIDESLLKPNRRILTPAQVYSLLDGIDPRLKKKDIPMFDSLHLTSFPVTPNGYRVTEMVHQFNGARLVFDERTRIYRKLVGFEGNLLDLSSRVVECMQYSRLFSENMASGQESANPFQKKSDTPKLCGLRFMKDVLLGKRSDHTFRTVVVGDPSLKLNEIGIPRKIAERLQVSENLNDWNRERLVTLCFHKLLEKGEVHVRRGRDDSLVAIRLIDDLQTGDKIFRTLTDGDTVLMNRPPSIHQHSLIAMSVKVLPTTSVVSLNPICCLPFRGDFDGDCLHGYVPQSIQAKVELDELVALDKQLVNRQNGRNLLALGQDSLTGAYLVNVEKNCYLNRAQMQQLQMYCPSSSSSQHLLLPPPAIIRASPSSREPKWTGMQLFGMLLPPGFDYAYPLNDVVVRDGELLSSSEGSAWLRDGEGNFIQGLMKHDKEKVLDIIYSAQEMLSQWLLMRGLSVSLADLCLSSDEQSRRNLTEEIKYGLREAEQVCNKQQLMVESRRDFLAVNGEEKEEDEDLVGDLSRFCCERQRSATLSKLAVSAFKDAYRDVQALAYRYGDESNSFLIMSKAGSKGNIGKLVQHSMCIGLQNSSVALSFGFPRKLDCDAWNDPNSPLRGAESFVPYGVIESSFLTGLNPLESFVHSVTSRDGSFSGNADLPGALSRKLMFFMRDIYAAYDGTVRNSFGNNLVQFTYETEADDDPAVEDVTGEAVGSLSACALSEAAYSALDQPISLLETSPLLNLKNVLECGSKKGQKEVTMSLYLSETLSKKKHGFEHGSLEIKNHLEKLSFSEIVSTSMIIFSPKTNSKVPLSPWVCHFHISEKVVKQKQLNAESVVSSLNQQYASRAKELKLDVVDLIIQTTNHCSSDEAAMEDHSFCITVTVVEASRHSSLELDAIRLILIPYLLDFPVKGFREIKRVDVLWADRPKAPKRNKKNLSGELFLKVIMYGDKVKKNLWSALLETCLPVMDMIDWNRSHPDNIRQCCSVYGIDAGRSIFLANLESAVSDTGKTILQEHLRLVADCLSVTGEFVALNAKGWSKQRQVESTPAPFTQACFSSPSQCFIKAAKEGLRDELQGSIDALAWGKVPSFGTGDQFEIIVSRKDHGIRTPVDVYGLLSRTETLPETGTTASARKSLFKPDILKVQSFHLLDTALPIAIKTLAGKGLSRAQLRTRLKWDDIEKFSRSLKRILYNYEIDAMLSERDEGQLMMALLFHPNRDEKIGPGFQGIKVASSKHGDARCFEVVRNDGTTEDFSYHKCVLGATEIIAPTKVNFYRSKYLNRGTV